MSRRSRPSERGSGLVLVMLLVVVVSALTHTAAVGARATVDATLLEQGRVAAIAAAEAGVELARLRLRDEPQWRGELAAVGRCRVEVTAQPTAQGWHVVVRSDCRMRDAGLPVRAVVEVTLHDRPGAAPLVTGWREVRGSRTPDPARSDRR